MQTSFPFNGESFPPFPPSMDGDKNTPTVKQEKDLEQPKQVCDLNFYKNKLITFNLIRHCQ
jgi:hypothetical protein